MPAPLLALATAACVAGNDPVKIMRLPFTDGLPNRVIMPRNQRFAYDQSIRAVGTHIIEIETIADLEAALEQPVAQGVAMIAVLGTHEDASTVRLNIIPRARARGIPVLVRAPPPNTSPARARGSNRAPISSSTAAASSSAARKPAACSSAARTWCRPPGPMPHHTRASPAA